VARVIRGSWLTRVLVLAAALLPLGGVQAASAAAPSGREIARTAQALSAHYKVRATLFGVWIGGRKLVTGAYGEALPGVPATTADHFRIGNITESITTTLLLQFVDQGRMRLDDPLSKWLPSLPGAGQVTLGMLASSTSGYADYVTSPASRRPSTPTRSGPGRSPS
jgi:D-alanyl-D-alanine carboxypeptidase